MPGAGGLGAPGRPAQPRPQNSSGAAGVGARDGDAEPPAHDVFARDGDDVVAGAPHLDEHPSVAALGLGLCRPEDESQPARGLSAQTPAPTRAALGTAMAVNTATTAITATISSIVEPLCPVITTSADHVHRPGSSTTPSEARVRGAGPTRGG